MQFTTFLAPLALLAIGAAAESSNIHFYSSGDCSSGDMSVEIPLDGTCQKAPQNYNSLDPKNLKANCNAFSGSSCADTELGVKEKGATTCLEVQGGPAMWVVCTEQSGL